MRKLHCCALIAWAFSPTGGETNASSHSPSGHNRGRAHRGARAGCRTERPLLPKKRVGRTQLHLSQYDTVRAGQAAQFTRSMYSALSGGRDHGQLGSAARQPASTRHEGSNRLRSRALGTLGSVSPVALDKQAHSVVVRVLAPADVSSSSRPGRTALERKAADLEKNEQVQEIYLGIRAQTNTE